MLGDKGLNLGIGLLLAVLVARHLGPDQFGILSYAVSLATLFGTAGHMGLGGLIVREIVQKPDQRPETLGTTLVLKFLGMTAGYLALIAYAFAYEGIASPAFMVIVVAGSILLLRPLDIIDFWFQAFIEAKYVTIARLTGLFSAAALKIAFVLLGGTAIYFAAANVMQAFIAAIALVVLFSLRSGSTVTSWRFSGRRARELLGQGWLIYLGSIFAVVYLKIDQIMLKWLADSEAVGVYAVAAQLSEAWYFIPTVIVASFFPKLIRIHEERPQEFYLRLQHLFDALFMLGVSVAIAVTLIASPAINFLFGVEYSGSATVLVIHVWAAIFIFMRAAFSKWIIIENVLIFSLVTQGMGATCNVLLNLYLIPDYGTVGAAYATLISYAMASFLALAFYRKTRIIFWLMLKSMFSPLRYAGKLAFR